jgi:membrane associated rhomboid family serine protease
LSSSFDQLITKPWTLISYGFLHSGFLHILFNCLILHFFGRLFLEYFTQKQALNFYILGTLFGGLAYLVSYNYFPLFEGRVHTLVGASAGVTAIVVGIATYIPNYQLQLRIFGYVKLWKLAGVFILFDLISLAGGNGGGHIAHIGGALFGYFYVSQSSNNSSNIFSWFSEFFSERKKPLQTVYKSTKKKNTRKSADDKQAKIDSILDKISKTGYETLTKEEKEFLFKQSN